MPFNPLPLHWKDWEFEKPDLGRFVFTGQPYSPSLCESYKHWCVCKETRTALSPDSIGIIGVILVSIWQLNTHGAVSSIDLARLVKNAANIFTEEIRSIMLVFLLLLIGSGKHYQGVITLLKPTECCLRVHHNWACFLDTAALLMQYSFHSYPYHCWIV